MTRYSARSGDDDAAVGARHWLVPHPLTRVDVVLDERDRVLGRCRANEEDGFAPIRAAACLDQPAGREEVADPPQMLFTMCRTTLGRLGRVGNLDEPHALDLDALGKVALLLIPPGRPSALGL